MTISENRSTFMITTHDYLLIVDFEATCSDGGSVPRNEMEIIEVGALLQRTSTFEVVSQFQSFVKPVRHPRLTPFCIELTTIEQDDVDIAPAFPEVVQNVSEWLSTFDDYVFSSWGDFDRRQVEQDANYHRVTSPFGREHINLKATFSEILGTKKRFGIGAALKRLGLTFQGTPHRGIDDVRNIARIIQHLCAGG